MKQIFITQNSSNDNISVYIKDSTVVITLNREDLPKLNNIEYANNPGIYVLIGDDNKRYVGQTAGQTIYQRLNQHMQNHEKDWFTKVVFFGRTDGHLTKTQTDFLEGKMIESFAKDGKFSLQNRTSGNTGWFDDLSRFQANSLWNEVFDILDNFAKVDLLGGKNLRVQRIARKDSEGFQDKKHNNNCINYSVAEGKIFFAKDEYMDAKMICEEGKFVILKGSKITPYIRANGDSRDYMERKRSQYSEYFRDFIVIKNITFRSPSGAANFVYGASVNGKTFWKDENDKDLVEFIKKRKIK